MKFTILTKEDHSKEAQFIYNNFVMGERITEGCVDNEE